MQYGNLYELADALEHELGPPQPVGPLPPALYHYTDARGFSGILTGKKIWATDYRFLNDVGEVTSGEALVQRTAETLRDSCSGAERTLLERFCEGEEVLEGYRRHGLSRSASVFIAAFSAEGNQLSQWRAYAADGSGYCVGLKRLPGPGTLQIGVPGVSAMPVLVGVPCVYEEETFCDMVRDALGRVAALFEKKVAERQVKEKWLRIACLWLAIQRVGLLVPRLKHSAFSEEREWRVIISAMSGQRKGLKMHYRASRLGLVPYVEIPLTDEPDGLLPLESVRVGPTQAPKRASEVTRAFLAGLGYGDPSLVVVSGIPYRAP